MRIPWTTGQNKMSGPHAAALHSLGLSRGWGAGREVSILASSQVLLKVSYSCSIPFGVPQFLPFERDPSSPQLHDDNRDKGLTATALTATYLIVMFSLENGTCQDIGG